MTHLVACGSRWQADVACSAGVATLILGIGGPAAWALPACVAFRAAVIAELALSALLILSDNDIPVSASLRPQSCPAGEALATGSSDTVQPRSMPHLSCTKNQVSRGSGWCNYILLH